MDGLKEDADILFVLTTNRPEVLEVHSGRPGRIDQAIEFPLPDETAAASSSALPQESELAMTSSPSRAAHRGVSAAFIKELMRRIAQSGGSCATAAIWPYPPISMKHSSDMLFAGGRLNVKLLGGAQQMAGG